jgi:hypothetical protein
VGAGIKAERTRLESPRVAPHVQARLEKPEWESLLPGIESHAQARHPSAENDQRWRSFHR